jgi:Na+-transporting methylmalonyl-CoA/oxaloacetate decarboxylase gamma subunit
MWKVVADNISAVAIGLVGLVLLLFVFLIIFRKQIGSLLDRALPHSLSPDVQTLQIQEQKPEPHRAALQIVPDSKAAQQLSDKIKNDFSTASLDQGYHLVSILAANNILKWDFESKKRIIFQSQLDALSNLRQKGPHALSAYYEEYRIKMDKHKEMNPSVSIQTDFETWVSFLTSGEYVEIHGGIAEITDRGDAFMAYIALTARAIYNF